jgi:hypothetical protein
MMPRPKINNLIIMRPTFFQRSPHRRQVFPMKMRTALEISPKRMIPSNMLVEVIPKQLASIPSGVQEPFKLYALEVPISHCG